MRFHTKFTTAIISIIIAGPLLVFADWTSAPASPPNNNVDAPLNVGDRGQTKVGGLILNTGGAAYGLSVQFGNVGIGTTNPGHPLDVFTSTIPSDGAISLFRTSGNSNTAFEVQNSQALWQFSVRNSSDANPGGFNFYNTTDGGSTWTSAMALTTGGNVGIGTVSPGFKLDVSGRTNSTQYCIAGANCISAWPSGGGASQWTTSGTNIYNNNTSNVGIGNVNPSYKLDVAGAVNATQYCISGGSCITTWPSGGGASQWTTSGSNIYYNTGNVGIGTVSPGKILDISIPGGGSSVRLTSSNVQTDFGINVANTFGFIYTRTNSPLVFGTNNVEAVRIDASGNVGIGTISPSFKLDAAGAVNATQYCINGGSCISTWPSGGGGITGVTAGSNLTGGGVSGNVTVGLNSTVSIAGTMTASAFYYSSDKNLKTNIKELSSTDALANVLKLQGVSFNWKSDGSPSVGVIAQDVEKVYPELVKTDSATGLKSVEYGNLVAPLIEAVKALNAKVDTLNAEVEALKASK